MEYCEKNLKLDSRDSFGHWHYAHFYYAQVQYRESPDQWQTYAETIRRRLLREVEIFDMGDAKLAVWKQGYVGPVYTTALNLVILQLDKACLPIYQR